MKGTKNLIFIVLGLGSVLFAGMLGYIIIEKWTVLDSLYMTVITIATVGFMEVRPLSNAGKIFTIFLILGGTGLLLYAVSAFIAFVVEGELTGILRRRKMEKRISQLKEHFIVCGAGSTGKYVIEEFIKTKTSFVIIEQNEEALKKFPQFEDLFYIIGDATSDAVLKEAGIERARGIIICLSTDKDNLFATLTAKSINPRTRIVAKVTEEECEHKLRMAGASTVISPNYIGGLRLASEMIRPTVVSFLDLMLREKEGTLRVSEIKIGGHSKFIGYSLKELNINEKFNLMVLAIKDAESTSFVYNPRSDTKIKEGDTLILMGNIDNVEKLLRFA